MAAPFFKSEANVGVFEAAQRKFQGCAHMNDFCGQMVCKLFHYQMDSSLDLLHHCGSCKANTSAPTTKAKARSP